MTFRKPFRAVPVRPARRFQTQRRNHGTKSVILLLGSAAIAGLGFGTWSAGALPNLRAIEETVKPVAVSMGLMRARTPQPGDFWAGCDAARAAGTAPIYAQEPGYRPEMDGDGDGIACEPYRGV